MEYRILSSCAAVLLCAGSAMAAGKLEKNPYGVCSHWNWTPVNEVVREAAQAEQMGARWIRGDFNWNIFEKKPGEWNFSQADQIVKIAREHRLSILPILDFQPKWRYPAWKHPDAWADFVRRIVTRYRNDLRYWEVWNEEDGTTFWPENPGPTTYVPFLKRTWEEIKKIDPALQVVYGGTSGIPMDFIEGTFKLGAGNYFDVMSVHPYWFRGVPEGLVPRLQALKKLMAQYGLQNKPIWFTEIGWSSSRPSPYFRTVMPAVFRRAGLEPSRTAVAVVSDVDRMFPSGLHLDPVQVFPEFKQVKIISLDQIKTLDVKEFPVLMPSTDEDFPMSYISDLRDYVKRGGTLFLAFGAPLYYDQRADGSRESVGQKHMTTFHIGWDAWWLAKVPKQAQLKPATGFETAFSTPLPATGNRFLHDRNLKPGDRFIPVIEAVEGNFRGPVVAIYDLNSDLRGKIIVSTLGQTLEGVSPRRQAELLPRIYLVGLSQGVERIFWYSLRSHNENLDTLESHFGTLHENLEKKPAFDAYLTLTKMLPTGSQVPQFQRDGQICRATWLRPDGKRVWAIWSVSMDLAVTLEIDGKIEEACNFLGEPVTLPENTTLTPGLIYLTGPKKITLHLRR